MLELNTEQIEFIQRAKEKLDTAKPGKTFQTKRWKVKTRFPIGYRPKSDNGE